LLTKIKPTYYTDLEGSITRMDERDIVFARQDLFRYFGKDSTQFKGYYAEHPQYLSYDERISKAKPLGGINYVDAPMFRSQFQFIDRIGTEEFVDGSPSNRKISISPDRAADKIRALGKLLGADLVRTGPLDQRWTYSYMGCTIGNKDGYKSWGTVIDLTHHKNAVALGFKMNLDLLASAPHFPTLLATTEAYAESAWTAVRLAEYIRMLGFSARAHHFSNYQVLAVPVAVDCGMGELSRAGYLLTREYGLAVRLSIVTTDLPLAYDTPVDHAIQSFCEQCRLCADQCPSGAIPKEKKTMYNGVKKWKLDEERCYAYWHVNGTDCGICMAVCPWTKPQTPFHRTVAKLASIKGLHQRWMAAADQLVYGKHKPAKYLNYLES
jgi:reductive dehalogenase